MPATNDDYIRPFGPNAPWNIPVADLPLAENSEELASKLWNDSYTDRELRNFNINNTSYTYPVYEVTEDTPYFPVVDKNGWGNLGGKEIPFDPSWKPAPGSDAQIIILDPATGREWNLWQAEFDGDSVNVSNGNLVPGSYFEKEDGFSSSRGVGIQYSAMLVRPEEVAQGVIEHALSMPIRNTSGSEFVAPGTKLEFPGVRPDGIPEGTRFALDVTDEQIDAHLASLPDSVPDITKSSLKTIMVAMRDYGWFITDTAGSAHIQLESTTTAQKEWEELGMIDRDVGGAVYPRDALDGLIRESRIVAFVPSDQYPAPSEEEDASPGDDLGPIPPDTDEVPGAVPPADSTDEPGDEPATEGEQPSDAVPPPPESADPPPEDDPEAIPSDEEEAPGAVPPADSTDEPGDEPTTEGEQPSDAVPPPPEDDPEPLPSDEEEAPGAVPPADSTDEPDDEPATEGEQPSDALPPPPEAADPPLEDDLDPIPVTEDDLPDSVPPADPVDQPTDEPPRKGPKFSEGRKGIFEKIMDMFRRIFDRDSDDRDPSTDVPEVKMATSRKSLVDDDSAALTNILPIVHVMEHQDLSKYEEAEDDCMEDMFS
jgi:hypothetical protein